MTSQQAYIFPLTRNAMINTPIAWKCMHYYIQNGKKKKNRTADAFWPEDGRSRLSVSDVKKMPDTRKAFAV